MGAKPWGARGRHYKEGVSEVRREARLLVARVLWMAAACKRLLRFARADVCLDPVKYDM